MKGRDFYDYLWYLSGNTTFSLSHLEERMRQSGHWESDMSLTKEMLRQLLIKRFSTVDFDKVKEDVIPFIKDPGKIALWSEEFFIGITKSYV